MTQPRMHHDEIEIDHALVRRLLVAQCPQWADLPLTRVASSGTNNALYRIGDDLVARLPRIESAVRHSAKEHEWLPRLAPHLPVEIPVPLLKGAPDAHYPWPWSIYRWIEGNNPEVDRLPEAAALARDLAAFITALQAVDPTGAPPAGVGNYYRGLPLEVRDAPTRTAVAALHDGIDIDTAHVTAVWDDALRTPRHAGESVFIHTDLAPGNVLTRDGRLAAVIDFEGLAVGDPASDLIVAWNLLSVEARDDFRDALQVDEATWQRGRGWALSIALIQLPYYRDTNPVLAANSRHTIQQVLEDHLASSRPR